MNNPDSRQDEEDRRERHWDPIVRWRVLQETITWAEAQTSVRRNTRESRLAEQQDKLGFVMQNTSGTASRKHDAPDG